MTSCPKCRGEWTQPVPAVYAGGAMTFSSAGPVVGVSHGHLATGISLQQGASLTALSRSVAPAPIIAPGGPITALVVISLLPGLLFCGGVALTAASDPMAESGVGQAFGVLAFIFLTIIVIVVGRWVMRTVRRRRVKRGATAAHKIWASAYYCHRCDVVFFPPSSTPSTELSKKVYTRDRFREIVWEAGHYADLL